MKLIDLSLLITHVIGFLIVFWLLRKFAWGRVLGFLERRRERIQGEFDEIERRQEEVARLRSEYEEHLRKIVDIQLGDLVNRLEARKICVQFTDRAREQLMDEGYDPSYGARPLKRTIQQRLENPLAKELLAGKFLDGDTIKVDGDGHRFTFEKAGEGR